MIGIDDSIPSGKKSVDLHEILPSGKISYDM